jgi:predicted nuclease of predicted toxin-antitoxin system
VKVLIDMNLSPRWVDVLAHAGIESAHRSTLGPSNAPDSEIMNFSRANGYVVLTHDLDFSAILAATHCEKPSVIQIRTEDVSSDAIGRSIIAALKQTEVELEEGVLLTVGPSQTRLRILPLTPKE